MSLLFTPVSWTEKVKWTIPKTVFDIPAIIVRFEDQKAHEIALSWLKDYGEIKTFSRTDLSIVINYTILKINSKDSLPCFINDHVLSILHLDTIPFSDLHTHGDKIDCPCIRMPYGRVPVYHKAIKDKFTITANSKDPRKLELYLEKAASLPKEYFLLLTSETSSTIDDPILKNPFYEFKNAFLTPDCLYKNLACLFTPYRFGMTFDHFSKMLFLICESIHKNYVRARLLPSSEDKKHFPNEVAGAIYDNPIKLHPFIDEKGQLQHIVIMDNPYVDEIHIGHRRMDCKAYLLNSKPIALFCTRPRDYEEFVKELNAYEQFVHSNPYLLPIVRTYKPTSENRKSAHHPHRIFYDYYETPGLSGLKTLDLTLKQLDTIAYQIIDNVVHFHQAGFAFGNLHEDNICLSKSLHIGVLGLATIKNLESASSLSHCNIEKHILAPEFIYVLLNNEHYERNGLLDDVFIDLSYIKQDAWALGLLLYFLYTGTRLIPIDLIPSPTEEEAEKYVELYRYILGTEDSMDALFIDEDKEVSNRLNLIRELLDFNPDRRMSIEAFFLTFQKLTSDNLDSDTVVLESSCLC